MAFLERTWALLTDPANREVLGWLGGGLVVVLGGIWTAFTYFRPNSSANKAESGSASVAANHGSVAAGRDIKGSPINISGSSQPGDLPRPRQADAGKSRRRGKGGKR